MAEFVDQTDDQSRVAQREAVRRTNELRLLYEVASTINRASTFREALLDIVKRLIQHNGWCAGHVYELADGTDDLLVAGSACDTIDNKRFASLRTACRRSRLRLGEDIPGRVLQTGEPCFSTDDGQAGVARFGDAVAHLGIRMNAAFPIKVDAQVTHVMEFFAQTDRAPDAITLETMSSIGTQLGWMLQRKRLKQRLVDRTMEEQRSLGQQLHEGLGQQIASIAILAQRLRGRMENAASPLTQEMGNLVEQVNNAMRQVRALAQGMMPVQVTSDGLRDALAELAKQTSGFCPCVFLADHPFELDSNATATNLYLIAREAVHNAVKHAQCRQVVVRLDRLDHRLQLAVEDDGQGLPTQSQLGRHTGLGMQIMRYRADLIGATLTLRRRGGGGTVVHCELESEQDDAQ